MRGYVQNVRDRLVLDRVNRSWRALGSPNVENDATLQISGQLAGRLSGERFESLLHHEEPAVQHLDISGIGNVGFTVINLID